MKIILLISLTLFCSKAFGQIDTLNYLKQFEVNKNNYVGQPMSKLLNDMIEIKPKTAWSASKGNKKITTAATRFKFCEMDYSFHNVITLWIEWQNEIPRDQTKYYEQKNGFYFTNDEKSFYGSKIVKDIKVFR
ncbi:MULTISPECIES: hypothetical protein [unclassified Chryseobacterium]|uniref:hypothetical protein n=1 Tax=unclassified Chryseobacterium TaxID=2593645 RepID=UPI001E578EC9|nr:MULTISPECIES: hypothetical protein [unclassified Chryseobacterium]MCD0478655.1 hypothetical protein [Chryseobacterium sp. LC2016-29]MDY0929668.1 hypothetical protein [Chryseobacterium sp. CFBP8996]